MQEYLRRSLNSGRLSRTTYNLLLRQFKRERFFKRYGPIAGISRQRFFEMVNSGEIAALSGVGPQRLAELRRVVGHQDCLYVDVAQLTAWYMNR